MTTYFLYANTQKLTLKDAEQRFNSTATEQNNELKRNLLDSQHRLLSLKAFFYSSDEVTELDFFNFSKSISEQYSYITMLSWIKNPIHSDSPDNKNPSFNLLQTYLYINNNDNNFNPIIKDIHNHLPDTSKNDTSTITISAVKDNDILVTDNSANNPYTKTHILFSLPINKNGINDYNGHLALMIELNHLISDIQKTTQNEPISLSIKLNDQLIAFFNPHTLIYPPDNTNRKKFIEAVETISIAGSNLEITSFSNIDLFVSKNYLSQFYLGLGLLLTLFLSFYLYRFIEDYLGAIDLVEKKNDDLIFAHKLISTQAKHLESKNKKNKRLDEIKQGLVNNEFCLYYQPKVNIRTGEIFGAEALIRWEHPTEGIIPPLEFIPLISGTDLECKIGDWVINQALEQLNEWLQEGINLEVSINITSYHLQTRSFISNLALALEKFPAVNPSCLQIEIVESSKLGDYIKVGDIVKECKDKLGIHMALDDFGTGYSSLTHLRNLPVSIIKIDQTFVRDMLDNPSDYAIVDGVIKLADSFNRKVIAEGVETTAHGLMLIVSGCEQAQGYAIAKPMPANVFPEWIIRYSPNQDWLECSQETRSIKQKKIKLFTLLLNDWINTLTINIHSSPKAIKRSDSIDIKHCYSEDWLKRSLRSNRFEKKWLKKLEHKHHLLLSIAEDLWSKYKNGDVESARHGLSKLQSCFKDINLILDLEYRKS